MIEYVDIRSAIERKYLEQKEVILLSLFETSEFYQQEKSMLAERFIELDSDGHWVFKSVPICVGNIKLLLG